MPVLDTLKMTLSGAKLSKVLVELAAHIQPGITTLKLDALAEEHIRSLGGIPSFKGYQGFPAAICACHTDEIVHGIPDDRPLEQGCLLTLDIGFCYQGWHTDAAFTTIVGGPRHAPLRQINLVEAAEAALFAGIRAAQPGNRTGDIGAAIMEVAKMYQVHPVRQFMGHGIGARLHMDPPVPNVGLPGVGPKLEPWTAIAIEPIFTLRPPKWDVQANGWTTKTHDGNPCAQFEQTIIITPDGPLPLTHLPPRTIA